MTTGRIAIWLAGSHPAARTAFSQELRIQLVRRGLAVDELTLASDGRRPEVDSRGAIGVPELCARLRQSAATSIVTEGHLSRAGRERVLGEIGPVVSVCIRSPFESAGDLASSLSGADGDRADQPAGTASATPGQPSMFEEPTAVDLCFSWGVDPLAAGVDSVLALLEGRGLITSHENFTRQDERLVIERLRTLGYL